MNSNWTVARFPGGSWSVKNLDLEWYYGGSPYSPEYESCDVLCVRADTGEEAMAAAKWIMRRWAANPDERTPPEVLRLRGRSVKIPRSRKETAMGPGEDAERGMGKGPGYNKGFKTLDTFGIDGDPGDGCGNWNCCAACDLKRALRPLRAKGSKPEKAALDALLESWTNRSEELEALRNRW